MLETPEALEKVSALFEFSNMCSGLYCISALCAETLIVICLVSKYSLVLPVGSVVDVPCGLVNFLNCHGNRNFTNVSASLLMYRCSIKWLGVRNSANW